LLGLLQDKIRSFIPNSGPRNALKVMNIKERKSPSPSKKRRKKKKTERTTQHMKYNDQVSHIIIHTTQKKLFQFATFFYTGN
jgi:23S rRNA pseudoU1915 N3-methylase RlmH